FHVDVFMPEAAIGNDVFREFDGLGFTLHAIDHPAFDYWVKAFRFIEYEFLVLNSIEPDPILRRVKEWPGRKLCILHNPELVLRNEEYREFLASPAHRAVVLGANVAASTLEDKDAWIAPFSPPVDSGSAAVDGRTRFVVQGVVEDRRNYASLLEAVQRLAADPERLDFEVVLLGKVFVPYGENLRQEIQRSPVLSRHIRFVDDASTYREYYRETRRADFILPLIDTTSRTYANYIGGKITSSTMTSFAFRIPAVLHVELQDAFRLPGFGYRDGGLHTAMLEAIRSTPRQRSKLKEDIDRVREEWIGASMANLAGILRGWGIRHESPRPASTPAPSAKDGSRYDEAYFRWQSPIGAFGGKANLIKFREFSAPQGTVADFGCGGGYLLENLPGRRKIGIEINPAARERARSVGIETYGTPEETPDGCIDLMVSNHALEHVHDPLSTLRSLLAKLRPGGTAVFVVPHDSVAIAFDPSDVNQHLFTWNPATLGNLFQLAGFQVVRAEAFQHMWMPDYEAVWNQAGEAEFHRQCEAFARKNGNYQIRVVAKRA
ncbi:MAG TPA: methyltransferase domain-containing protein, partial [Fibrobacteria bacterium]|nr:methyltransferase domain-containing protein [Fibrobacteria bacterium]